MRFHGRGGQGAVTAGEILADAAFREGKYIVEAGLTEEAEISGYKAMVERKEKASKLKAK